MLPSKIIWKTMQIFIDSLIWGLGFFLLILVLLAIVFWFSLGVWVLMCKICLTYLEIWRFGNQSAFTEPLNLQKLHFNVIIRCVFVYDKVIFFYIKKSIAICRLITIFGFDIWLKLAIRHSYNYISVTCRAQNQYFWSKISESIPSKTSNAMA